MQKEAHMLRTTVFMMLSTHMDALQELGVPLCVSTSMHMLPPAVTCPVYLRTGMRRCWHALALSGITWHWHARLQTSRS